jgi:diguanylate cyclase (GGDEF)-like protein
MGQTVSQQLLKSSSTLRLQQLRLFIVIGTFFMMSFMLADLPILPESIKQAYLISRVGLQLPVMLVFLALTFLPFYARIHHQVLWISVLLVSYANCWVIVESWLIAEFSFPYEGMLFYALYATFVLRLSFKYAAIFLVLSALGFVAIAVTFPIYGDLTRVKVGFVIFGFCVILMAVNRIEQTFKKLNEANEKLTALGQIDQLTGIYNRGTFDQKFRDILSFAKRTSTPIGVFMIDLDNFKDYNDGYGHLQGDEVIKQQAQILSEIFSRDIDLVARYGGEEFVVVCIGNDQTQCETFAQKILDKWTMHKVPHCKGAGKATVSCSIGINWVRANKSHNTMTLLNVADKALYQAKKSGRATFVNGSGLNG